MRFFHRKYAEDPESGRLVKIATAEEIHGGIGDADQHIHMLFPSHWPLVLALGLPIVAYGIIFFSYSHAAVDGLIVILGAFGWILEPPTADDSDLDPALGAAVAAEGFAPAAGQA
jgi:cytochrome c oxidase subunit 1